MGSVNTARMFYGLKAQGVSSSTNVSGRLTLGQDKVEQALTDADIFYSIQIVSTGSGDTVDIDLQTGIATASAGTPTISDGDGEDFEGVDMPNADSLEAVLLISDAANVGAGQLLSTTDTFFKARLVSGSVVLLSKSISTSNDLSIEFVDSGDTVTVVVAAKTA